MEKILPLLKSILYNFDYFLIVIILLIWFFVNKKPTSNLGQKIVNFGNKIYAGFIKLAQTKILKLLFIFFILNFIIRLIMAVVVPEMSLLCGSIMNPHYINLANSLYQGEGFTTHVVWNNFLQPTDIIRPDFFRVPFYPILITLSFYLFGHSYLSAQLVNVIAASLLPIFVYLLTYVLTKSRKIATLLLIFISFNTLILNWVTIIGPEIIFCCCVILLLYFIYQTKNKKKSNFYALLVGVLWALTYLTRTDGLFIFLPVILFYYLYQNSKKEFIIKILLTGLSFLIIASPYLVRNYLLTKNPFYNEFNKISMIEYVEHGNLIESPVSEYKNIYDLAIKKPFQVIERVINHLVIGIISIPTSLICSYALTLLVLIGIFCAWKKDRQKYYLIFLTILLNFLFIAISGFYNRYYIALIILFYFFACLEIFKLLETTFKNNNLAKSFLIIYISLFILFNGIIGIIKGTIPYIPHSFYQRFDAKKYYSDLEKLFEYIKENTQLDDVIMVSRRPYEIYYFTQRPVIIFPFTDELGVQKFMQKYQVKWIIRAGQSKVEDDKFMIFWPEGKYPENIKLIFSNAGGELYKVEYYIE